MSTYDRRRTPEEAWRFANIVGAELHGFGLAPIWAGSLRRGNVAVGDLDGIVVTDQPLSEQIWPSWIEKATAKKAHGWKEIEGHGRMMIDLWACPPESVGAMLLFLTGPAEMNVWMRNRAIDFGWMLTQYGLFEAVEKTKKSGKVERVCGKRLDTPRPNTSPGASFTARTTPAFDIDAIFSVSTRQFFATAIAMSSADSRNDTFRSTRFTPSRLIVGFTRHQPPGPDTPHQRAAAAQASSLSS